MQEAIHCVYEQLKNRERQIDRCCLVHADKQSALAQLGARADVYPKQGCNKAATPLYKVLERSVRKTIQIYMSRWQSIA